MSDPAEIELLDLHGQVRIPTEGQPALGKKPQPGLVRPDHAKVVQGEPVGIPGHGGRPTQVPAPIREAEDHLIHVEDPDVTGGLEGNPRPIVLLGRAHEEDVHGATGLPVVHPYRSRVEGPIQNLDRSRLDERFDARRS